MDKRKSSSRLFVLDTNVLMHDPASIFHFGEHDVYLPMVVLEELDNWKKGSTEIARNVRQTSRFLNSFIEGKSHREIEQGIAISTTPNSHSEIKINQRPHGRIFFQTNGINISLPPDLPGNKPDNSILATTLALQKTHPERNVILISRDINLRIKANVLGIKADDYTNDRVLEDATQLHSGIHKLPANFWETHSKKLDSWQEAGRTFYRVQGPLVDNWCPNDGLILTGDQNFEAMVRKVESPTAIIEVATEYRHNKNSVWGITARNQEQNFALNALMDPNIDFVTLVGSAGSGKTLLTLAAGLAQTLEHSRYREIVMTRVTVPVGEDIGFLPGTEEEKMTPWMGALLDNLEVLNASPDSSDWERSTTEDLLRSRIKIRSLNFMRGRTFLNKFIIIDEAQNLTPKQVKTLVTRAGPGAKIVCIGDIRQIDTPYLSDTNCGLTYAVDHFKAWPHSAHVTLVRGERSRLADYAAEVL